MKKKKNQNNTDWVYSLACCRQTKSPNMFTALIIHECIYKTSLWGFSKFSDVVEKACMRHFYSLYLFASDYIHPLKQRTSVGWVALQCGTANTTYTLPNAICSPDHLRMWSKGSDLNVSSMHFGWIHSSTKSFPLVTGSCKTLMPDLTGPACVRVWHITISF